MGGANEGQGKELYEGEGEGFHEGQETEKHEVLGKSFMKDRGRRS